MIQSQSLNCTCLSCHKLTWEHQPYPLVGSVAPSPAGSPKLGVRSSTDAPHPTTLGLPPPISKTDSIDPKPNPTESTAVASNVTGIPMAMVANCAPVAPEVTGDGTSASTGEAANTAPGGGAGVGTGGAISASDGNGYAAEIGAPQMGKESSMQA